MSQDESQQQVLLTAQLAMCAELGLYQQRVIDNCWIEDEDGFTGWRWEKYGVTLKIVCAANRYKDVVVLGLRHGCPRMQMQFAVIGHDALQEYAQGDTEQGFVDQYGMFRTRAEARIIYEASGGLPARGEWTHAYKLFSEDLY